MFSSFHFQWNFGTDELDEEVFAEILGSTDVRNDAVVDFALIAECLEYGIVEIGVVGQTYIV